MQSLDFMVAGYAKSGNNWLEHIFLRHLIGPTYDSDKAIGLIKGNEVVYRTEGIETPKKEKVLYMVRHPLDILVSYRNYEEITGRVVYGYDKYVKQFILNKGIPGRKSWCDHVKYWRFAYTVKYDNLLYKGKETLDDIFKYLNIEEENTQQILDDVSFDTLRKKEDIQAENNNWGYFRSQRPTDIKAIQNNKRFYNVGKSFYFPELLSEKQIEEGMEAFKNEILHFWPEQELTRKYLK